MADEFRQDLEEDLKDPEYAKAFGAELAKAELAVALAKARKMGDNITQDKLADMLGVRQPYIAKLEGGNANPTIAAVGRMLAVLGRRLVIRTEPLLTQSDDLLIRMLGDIPTFNAATLDIDGLVDSIRSGRPSAGGTASEHTLDYSGLGGLNQGRRPTGQPVFVSAGTGSAYLP